jgi:aminoglycoside phosphotransferase (APT) family kinase protein
MPVDPRDSPAVAAAVAARGAEMLYTPVMVVGTPAPIGGGLDSYIHAVELAGGGLPPWWERPLVVRLLPSVDRLEQAHREAAVQSWADEHGYPVPSVLAVIEPGDRLPLPTQVMERAPGGPMIEALTSRPWRIPALVRQLAELAARLHALPVDGWPAPPDGANLAQRRLGLPHVVVEHLDRPELAAALERADALVDAAMTGPLVPCHGDFHPLNVVVDGDGHAAVIDWTDAGLGPREADVSRTALLFNVAWIVASSAVERVALRTIGPRLERRYRQAYAALAPVDPMQIARWSILHTIHGWAQVEMLHAGGFEGESSASPDSVPGDVAPFLRARALDLLAEVERRA